MNPTCPTGCTTPLPIVSFDDCNPEIQSGEVSKIYLANADQPFTDVEDIAEWTERLSNSAEDDESIRTLTVAGDKPKPSSTKIDISGGRKVTLSRDHVLNADIDETNDTNHDFVRTLQCGGQYLMWYETSAGKYIYGGNEGILVTIEPDMVIPRSRGEKIVYQLTMDWKSMFLEQRTLSPMYSAT